MEKRELLNLIKNGESHKIEFKSKADDGLGKAICSFANTGGGFIFLGVDDRGSVIGVSKKNEREVANFAHSCKPSIYPEVACVEVDEKNVLVVEVKKSGMFHSFSDIAYIRV